MLRKSISAAFAGVILSASGAYAMETDMHDWRLGVQCWTFKNFTLFEAIDKTRSLGLTWLEAYPGQSISADIQEKFTPEISADIRRKVKQKLDEAGIRLVNFGVYQLPNNEETARKAFEFARETGIETIVSEPPFEAIGMLDGLCQEYEIRLAIHNHPKPSRYWDPQIVLENCKGTSKWIGACADTGHWVRSGLDPVECLKKLEGRIISLHLKEIQDGHDVVWGSGENRVAKILEELHRQNFSGVCSIEHEKNWENNIPEIRESVRFFNQKYTQLFLDEHELLDPSGWEDLFEADMGNADFKPGSWAMENGVLVRKGGGDIWTKAEYGDFILDLEFKVFEKTNSGVFIRAGEKVWLPWVEVQISNSAGKPVDRRDTCGAIYDILAPRTNAVLPAGQWNHMVIKAAGPAVKAVLNDQPIIDMNLDNWKQAHENPDGSKNKFDIAYKDLPRKGFIGLQDHGFAVEYRNVKIKEL